MTHPIYPDIEVELTGQDGNGFFIVSRVRRKLKDFGVDADEIETFTNEATSGDYDPLLQTCMKWVRVS